MVNGRGFVSQETKEITKSYLTTTSSRGGPVNAGHYEAAAPVLRRRLGPCGTKGCAQGHRC
jgi:hypothetical protein